MLGAMVCMGLCSIALPGIGSAHAQAGAQPGGTAPERSQAPEHTQAATQTDWSATKACS
jgi:hypothetical protein